MSDNVPVGIEAIDTHALHTAPRDTAIAFADRRDRRTDADLLAIEAPATELHRPLRNEGQSLALKTKPEIACPVGEDATHLGRIDINAEDGRFEALQPTAALGDAEQSVSARTYIYNIVLIFLNTTVEYLLTSKDTHVDVGIGHGIVAETGNATESHDEQLAIALNEALHLTFRLEMAERATRLHHHGIACCRLPEPSFGIFEGTAVIVVVGSIGKAFCHFQLPVAVDNVCSIAGSSHKDAPIGKL